MKRIKLPEIGLVPMTCVCSLKDFRSLSTWIKETIPFGVNSFGKKFPHSCEYRKHWEVAQAARALAFGRALSTESEVLGVGAGNEPTIFWLTKYVKRVFATDLYLADGWDESANLKMLTNPQAEWFGTWKTRKLVTQHMDGRNLRYENCSFDGVFSSSSIEHFGNFSDVTQAVREIYRVLKPGGIFSVSTEYRLSGQSSGLPGTLLFNKDELVSTIIETAPWEVVGPERWDIPNKIPIVSFEKAANAVRSHIERFGELVWSELHWPEYPHIFLEYGELLWTSVHLTLRKPN